MGNGESIEGAEDFPPKVPLFQNGLFYGVPDGSGIVTKPLSMGLYEDLSSVIEDKVCSLTGVQFVKHKIGLREQIQIPPDSTLFQLGNGKFVVLKKEEVAMADQKSNEVPNIGAELEKAAIGMLEGLGYTVTRNQNEAEVPPLSEEQKEAARKGWDDFNKQAAQLDEELAEVDNRFKGTAEKLFRERGWGKPKF